ncbi:MAG: rplA [Chlamydiales bacterium]|jgi:large subunit ribosomal protein L1|nr:rplA [Chlamydiales bacterium]
MARNSKRYQEMAKLVEANKLYSLEEAVAILQHCPPVKFDQSVETSVILGIDPRKSDQAVRGTVSLPNGTGKSLRVLVLARGEKIQEAVAAGADFAGHDELIMKIQGGWTDFDAMVATPDMMREVGKLGKILGPRGLMPTPKAGTVTTDVAKAVQELKMGKVEFKADRHGAVNGMVGKLSFSKEQLVQNFRAWLSAVVRAKPATAKGQFIRSIALSSTMGPGMKIDLHQVDVA